MLVGLLGQPLRDLVLRGVVARVVVGDVVGQLDRRAGVGGARGVAAPAGGSTAAGGAAARVGRRRGGGRRGGGGLRGGLRLVGVDRLHELDRLVAPLLLRLDRHEEAGVRALDLGRVAGHGGLRLGDRLRVDGGAAARAAAAAAVGDRRRALVEAAAAGEVLGEVGVVEARDLHDVAGLGRVQELVPAHGDPDVVDVAGLAEEDEVARLEVAALDRLSRCPRRTARRSRAGSGCRPWRRPTARGRSSRSRSAASSRRSGRRCRCTSAPP